MKLVLIRHATRSPYDQGDAALSTFGLAQAQTLAKSLAPIGELPVPTKLVSSPKKRAQQTLSPLADETGIKLTIDSRLDERKNNETLREFEVRVKTALDIYNSLPENETVFLCSHMDWLEVALTVIDCDLTEIEIARGFAPCEYQVFKVDSGMCYGKTRGIVGG